MAFLDQYPFLNSIVAKVQAEMRADPSYYNRVLAGEIDEDGRPMPRSPKAVARVKQAKLTTGRIGSLGRSAIGPTASFVGGHPDLPASFDWPSWQSRDLIFLAQINLADLRNAGHAEWLPSSGKLLFFIGSDEELIPGASRIIHVPESRHVGVSAQEASERKYISFERHLTYAPLEPEDYPCQVDDRNEVMDWWENLVPSRNSVLWQAGGWPTPMQTSYDMQHECERIYRGLTWEDREAQYEASFQQAKDMWHLIGQFEPSAIMSQPAGCMRGFFWVKVDNGKALFDQAWLVGQAD